MTGLPSSLLERLASVDTPTVCNAIEVAQKKRGFDNFTHHPVVSTEAEAPAIVGYAVTAKVRGKTAPQDSPEVLKERRMGYYRYVAEAASPAIVVIEDTDGSDACAAFWGEINTSIHKGFGLKGVVTNGVVRDLGDLPAGFPVIAGLVGPSHGFVHLLDYDCVVEVFGMKVRPGDLVHADRHGACVIPHEVHDIIDAALTSLFSSEAVILDAARRPGFDYSAFEAAWAAFEKART